jgi:poly [ADP-ribose] polymerase
VRRLDAAICKDEKIAVAAAATEVADGYGVAVDGVLVDGKGNGRNNKRKRSGDGDEEGNGDTSIDLAKLEGMSYRELQGLAKARGLAANGGKKDVIQRLLSATVDPVAVADGGPQGEKEVIKGLQFCRSICFFFPWIGLQYLCSFIEGEGIICSCN